METSEIKELLKEDYPAVYKSTRAWLIKDDMANVKAANRIRQGLMRKGFRSIDIEENMGETLDEAEDWLNQHNADAGC